MISIQDRDPALEEKVKYYLSIIPTLPKSTRKVQRTLPITTTDPYERSLWEREEIRRIKEGHFGMCGKMYFWYNYVKMKDVKKGLVRPEFRIAQNEWFKTIEECEASEEWGLICVKRRRVGASWMEAADALHDAITKANRTVGMTSKTAEDAIELFKKVKFIYDNLPDFLRPTTLSNTRSSLQFGWKDRDSKGNVITRGSKSEIITRAPTDTSFEGYALAKLVLDEGGKTEGLKTIFSLAEPTLMQGTKRIGVPIVAGTSGDIGKEGKELMEMWYNADTHKLRRFFFGGWMGMDDYVDEFGNDMVEDVVRWIVYERKNKEALSMKEYISFIQQYPLTVEEAFKANTDTGIGNKIKIERQRTSLFTNPVKSKTGYFMMDANNKSIFVPSPRGYCVMYEEPDPQYKDLWVAGVDSIDHTTTAKDASSLAMYIMKKQHGTTGPKIVLEYVERPEIPMDAYEQCLLALMYYNNTKIMIERNRFSIVQYFEERGAKHLMATTPQGLNRLIASPTYNIGYYKTKASTQYTEELFAEYIENHYELIPSLELLDECNRYGMYNTDRISAMFAVLLLLKDDKTIGKEKLIQDKTVPNFSYKYVNGKLKLVR